MTKLLRIVDPGFVSLKSQLTLCHLWGESPAISAKRMTFCGQKYCAKILVDYTVTYIPDFDQIWPRKMIQVIPELGTSGDAAVHSP